MVANSLRPFFILASHTKPTSMKQLDFFQADKKGYEKNFLDGIH